MVRDSTHVRELTIPGVDEVQRAAGGSGGPPAATSYFPAASFRDSTRSVRSQVKFSFERPKWP